MVGIKATNMASVAIVFRKDKLNKKNQAPIHFRIIKHRRVRYISSGIILGAKYWDAKRNRIKIRYPNSNRLNSFLSNKFNELQDQVFEYETKQKGLTTHQLKNQILGRKPTLLFPFTEEILQDYKQKDQIGTYDKNKSVMAKLATFVNKKTFAIQDITVSFLIKYERYLRNKKGNSVNTIANSMKFLRKVVNDAIRQEIIKSENSAFNKYIIKTEKTERAYLTEEELKLIENLQLTPFTRMDTHRDMFVFACYVGGLRISDLLQLKWEVFDETHVSVTTRKTGAQVSLKLPKKAHHILDKYKQWNKTHNSLYLFPILENELDENNARDLDTVISKATSYINKNLKIIAKKTGIKKHLSTHIARHTWATRALRKGITIDKVSKLMGHANIRETQIYAKIVGEELDKAMDKFDE